MRVLSIMVLMVVMSGCMSVNMQLSSLYSSGVFTGTTVVDVSSEESFVVVKADTRSIAQTLLNFLDSGEVATLTEGTLKDKLYELIPFKYQWCADAALAQVKNKDVNLGVVGSLNIERMKAYLRGVVTGCDYYLDTYHPVAE